MQTFLPYENFEESARVLDMKRLGKQRLECVQIMRILKGHPSRWANHPAVLMWEGHDGALLDYTKAICAEWTSRGYIDNQWARICEVFNDGQERSTFGYQGNPPPWLGWEDFHASHRSNLLRKKPEHYEQFGWVEPPNLPYVWPSKIILPKGLDPSVR